MDQNPPAMSEDDDRMIVMTGNSSTRRRVSLLEGIGAGYKALTFWLKGDIDLQTEHATKAGNAMLICSREIGNADLLDTAIEFHRKALSLRPPGHPNRADMCIHLGTSLYERYRQAGNVALLDEVIQLEHQALALRPPGYLYRADTCVNLWSKLHERYQEAGDVAMLVEAIKLACEALALRPPGHPYRANSCANLGTSLHMLYEQLEDAALLDEAIEVRREALTLQPLSHPDRSDWCIHLGTSLYECYQQSGEVALLDEVIELERQALALRPPGHPYRAHTCVNLGASLHMRYQQTKDIALLDEAIELERESLALRPPGHPDRANTCVNLGSSLHERYQQTGNVALLDEAIKLEREALALQPLGHSDRVDTGVNLGSSLRMRYKEAGDIALLDEAIELAREAFTLRSPVHPDRAKTCMNLGILLHMRYEEVGDVALLSEAIDLRREALALRPPGHPDRANACVNLGSSLYELYQQVGDVAMLDEAIKLEREALALQPPGHPGRTDTYTNLGSSLHVRSLQAQDVALLDEVITLEREALTLRPSGHPDRANACANLGSSLYERSQQVGDVAMLDEAINNEREALALRPPGHPKRANTCVNLGSSLHMRYQQLRDVALLEEAIDLKREALALRPPGHPDRAGSCANLADSLSAYFEQTGNVVWWNEAMKECSYASEHSPSPHVWYPLTQLSKLHLLHNSPRYSVLNALEYLQQSFQHDVDQIHRFISLVCLNVLPIWDNSSIWTPHITSLLVDVYANVVDRLPLMAGFVLNTSSQLETLKSTRQVGSDACIAALLAEQPATAVTLLDRARGVVWSQALHQRDPQMDGAPKDLAIELEDLLRAIATSTPAEPARLPDHSRDIRHNKNTRIQAILREIRAMPGLARFMLGSTYETLREAARDHPVVVLVAARDRAFALIIPSSEHASPDILALDVAWHDLQSLADTAGKANLRYRTGTFSQDISLVGITDDRERAMRTGNFSSDSSPLASLWRNVAKPVLMRLHLVKEENPNRRPRLHWYTAGEFASIPVHAAGIYTGEDQECCSDYVVSSYTPTLTTLLRARKGLRPIKMADAKLLLVAAEHTADARLPPLDKVKLEMRDICSVVEKAKVKYAAPSRSVSTTAQATAALPAANLVHIACHGLQHTSEPLKSAFHLSDHDVLSVSALMELNLEGAFLAFLSACETAKGDRDQPDQAIHLAATMLFVGFKTVVATMWAMRDEDGPVISKAFYEKLLEGETITADAIPYALDHAVRKLREAGVPVERWATFIHVGA